VSHLYTANHCDVPVLSVSINSERKESVAIGDAARACVRAFWASEPFGTWKQSIIVARDDGALWSVVFDDERMNALQINDESLNGAEDFVSVPKRLIVHAYEFCLGGPDKSLVSELAKYAGVDSVSV
jgi:prolyl oligopeptidase PreP (S9A serine peptidase family)